jgi:hypothetical protein
MRGGPLFRAGSPARFAFRATNVREHLLALGTADETAPYGVLNQLIGLSKRKRSQLRARADHVHHGISDRRSQDVANAGDAFEERGYL